MARKDLHQLAYTAIRIEGGLIPAEELTRLTTLESPEKTEQTEAHYQIPKGLKLRDEIARNFKIAQSLWADFNALRQRQDAEPHRVTVHEFLLPLLRQTLGYTDLATAPSIQASNSQHHSYQVGHAALGGRMPVVLAGHDQPLDQAAERFGDTNPDTGRTRKRSAYMLAQEALNASDTSLWAVVSNGLRLRILRDNPSLTRPAYVEVDLEAIFTEELYADFTAFWLLAHSSRFGRPAADGAAEPTNCPWEHWRNAGQQTGVTARMNLRFQVADALRSLGTGFLCHPANAGLRAQLQDPDTSSQTRQAFFEQLLSLVYRLIFLATVEDRTDATTGQSLVFAPKATDLAQHRYWAGYSLTWLRERALRRSSHDTQSDLWEALSITFDGLATGQPALGLPALGGLFAAEQCPLLATAQLDNRHLLSAVFQLGYFRQPTGLTRVNYRDMGPEELGSVYESLLELVPDIQSLAQPHAARLAFVGDDESDGSTKGNTRKLTGSYYTPDSLVQELIKSALEPVIAATVQANPERPVDALLQLTVCDPACGSGHFLLAAARRLADEVAKLRALGSASGAPTPADYRHALRDVVGHCIYGVDKNPMAIALAKTALWLEAYTPDRPLTFIDHHLQVGDALLGVLDPKILEHGIPDAAYTVLSGDDKTTASALKKANKQALKSWKQIDRADLFHAAELAAQADAVEHIGDENLERIADKRRAWREARARASQSTLARLADTYVAAFLAPKVAAAESTIPLSSYLWGLLREGGDANPAIDSAAADLCRAHSVFHWWLAFPQVAARGGFAVMLGNPPWERIKLQEEEFFASRSPLVASARNKAERGQRIELLRQGLLLHTLYPDVEAAEGLHPPNRAEMRLFDDFIAARRGAEAASLYAHDSGRYPLTGVGDVNTYALFAETLDQLTGPAGRAGFIVPTGIATDDSTKAFFGGISQRGRLASLYDFENSEAVFPAVHRSYKFSLMTLGAAPAAEFVCFATQVPHLADPARRFTLTPDEFRLINPNTRTCPVFRSQRDAELTKKLYRAAPVLIREAELAGEGPDARVIAPEHNPWGISFQRMLDMSNDSGLFLDRPAAPGEPPRLPLYEAKMIHQFDHRWATYVDAPDKPAGLDTADLDDTAKADPARTVRPRYWVDQRQVLARIARVPARVANAWLALHTALDAPDAAPADRQGAHQALTLALALWVAGAVFRRAADAAAPRPAAATTPGLFDEAPAVAVPPETPAVSAGAADNWTAAQCNAAAHAVEHELPARYPALWQALLEALPTTAKRREAATKAARQDTPTAGLGLSDAELAALTRWPAWSDRRYGIAAAPLRAGSAPAPASTASSGALIASDFIAENDHLTLGIGQKSLKNAETVPGETFPAPAAVSMVAARAISVAQTSAIIPDFGADSDHSTLGKAVFGLKNLDDWLHRRSPQWLMGWRDITNATNERTVIASVVPRVGVGNNLPLMLFKPSTPAERCAALLGNLGALVLDFVARHKVGGTHLNYFIYKQLPVLPPEHYTEADLAFIVPRVLELTFTAHDLQPWADDLRAAQPAADPRPASEHAAPFPWNPERRAQLRAELDAYYARLYGLTRDELRYILDPADVLGPDYPSETFRVLKNNEMRQFGEYRTQRLVLAAWDAMAEGMAE